MVRARWGALLLLAAFLLFGVGNCVARQADLKAGFEMGEGR